MTARGMLTAAKLEEAVAAGEVDTVLVAFPDLQGRLVGKRVTGSYWREHMGSGTGPLHMCDYLLAVDSEMNVLPGYEFASWDKGYGDMVAQPDLTTIRYVPWLEKTALVLCDLFDENTGAPIEVSPRRILQRQVERAAAAGFTLNFASELEFFVFRESLEEAHAKDFAKPHAPLPRDRGLPHPPDDARRVPDPRDPQRHRRCGNSRRVLQGRSRQGTTRDQPRLRRCRRDGRPARHLQERGQGDRRPAQPRGHVHGQVLVGRSRLVVPRPLEPLVGRRERRADVGRGTRPITCHLRCGAGSAARSPADASSRGCTHRPSTRTSATNRSRGRRPLLAWSIDNRTCGYRIVGHGASFRLESRIPGADANPYLAFAATIAAGLHGIENGIDPGPRFNGNAYADPHLARVPDSLVEAIDALAGSAVAPGAFGPDVHAHLLNTARQEWAHFNRAVTDWERRRNFDQW